LFIEFIESIEFMELIELMKLLDMELPKDMSPELQTVHIDSIEGSMALALSNPWTLLHCKMQPCTCSKKKKMRTVAMLYNHMTTFQISITFPPFL
jgi:hypothetical protein